MNLNSVEKAYLHLSVALLCNSFVTVKNTFDTTFFLFLCFSTVPGNWSSWGDWSPCSKTCGNGTITRTRTCDNPAPAYGGTDCVGAANMTKDCLDQLCPGQLASFDLSLQLKDRDKLTSDALRKETLSFYRARNQSNMCHPLKKNMNRENEKEFFYFFLQSALLYFNPLQCLTKKENVAAFSAQQQSVL